ncbi:MAG: UDP-2,3-diacylglucosamine diphosphatase [Terrimonas sp.]|uniref:UDP-2,3-diacylglucosamine diphosphatase n=1 Tax=Terrimonas sp. TaxID=1914338 RepID=UPI0009282612|nr:UDP-2,3-diacylglucosamine diphosphatase [Terrimonas sp.]MBN8788644.1 UDP-2,3-diacylglucosamine diphosphatase [Terrimonas sp.]OJY87906.1 MAG: UDP-2,3-diacylglucosamine hydrolase [Sphingobacteriales bacterium 40-81]PVD49429.1 UDP-2,3-diacylglucosamine hydrolase [Terrimonas sp.]
MEKRAVDVVVISDVHLGTYGCQAKKLAAYLKSITPSILILNGDIFDAWQFSKRYFPASHMNVLKEIINHISNGIRVFYITGNHDETLRRYSALNAGNLVLTDKLVLEIDNKMTWIFHGDVFDNTTKGWAKTLAKLGSSGYGALILLNRSINAVLKFFGKERVSLSKSVMEGVNKAVTKINDFETTAAEIAIEKHYDYVICGHIHKPQKRVISNENGSVTYLNSGDWVEHCTALEYYKKEWKLFEFEESAFPELKVEKEKPVPNVITDEISYHISSLAG